MFKKKVHPRAHLLHLIRKTHLVWKLKKSHDKIKGKNLPIRRKRVVKQKSKRINLPETPHIMLFSKETTDWVPAVMQAIRK